ncbi:MAG: hypothetical protein EA412_06190 [Chitinophagaceae bacterium]|nr:MAG: hypothetical protein EA412_06190 [Chitinophagaceae bacterium]
MNNLIKLPIVLVVFIAFGIQSGFSGNPDRIGEAGAYELLINPWSRSTGVNGINSANVSGIESANNNIAGLAKVDGTEILFSHTMWMRGSGISINAMGLAQPVGESGVMGLSLMSLGFGDIERTTTSSPEGGLGAFNPQFFNISLAYSRNFSNSISAGLLVRVISQRIDDITASGAAIDGGIQYQTGPRDNVKFGIALRNVGTPMRFGGDGLSFRGPALEGDFEMTQAMRAEKFELPSLLTLGGSYDFYLDDAAEIPQHRLTVMVNFNAHSFGYDQFGGAIEYAFNEMFMIRGGYLYEEDLTDNLLKRTAFNGFSAGATLDVPLREDGARIGVDYSFRPTNPFDGTHALGVRIGL